MKKKIPVIAMAPGDHAGIGPEIMAKTLAKKQFRFIPVIVTNQKIFESACQRFAPSITGELKKVSLDYESFDDEDTMYIIDIAAGSDIEEGKRTKDSGKLTVDTICAAIKLKKKGKVDAIYVAPSTKESIYMASPDVDSEFALFDREFKTGDTCVSVIKRGPVFTARATAHCALNSVLGQLSIDRIVGVGDDLINTMRKFGQEKKGIIMSGINKYVEGIGFLGDEEERIIAPAVEELKKRHPGISIAGPFPPNTVSLKVIDGEVGGVGYLYHDQGSAIIKSWANREEGKANIEEQSNVIYTHIPCRITSSGHGSALDIAGKGVANEKNTDYALRDLLTMVEYDLEHGIQD